MAKRTEKLEQEFIDAWIEAERVPNHEYRLPDAEGEALPPQALGKVVLENTDEYNRAFGWTDMGEYLERE